MEYLFDISNHNDPVIDWAIVVAPDDVPGGWLKVSQATDFIDGLADDYVAQAKGSGAKLGGYHFGDHRYDALAQARFFFDLCAQLGLLDPDDLAPMYDVENWTNATWPDRATIRRHVNIWLDEAVRRGCKRALIYGSLSWWLGGLLVPADYVRDDIEVLNWIAVYNGQPGDLQGWDHPRDALHQYTSDGRFDGIDGRVDKSATLRGRTSADLTISSGRELPVEIIGTDGKPYPAERMFQFWDEMFNQMRGDLVAVRAGVAELSDDEAKIVTAVLDGTRKIVADAPKPVAEVDMERLIVGLRSGLGDELVRELGRRLVADPVPTGQ